MLTTLKEHVDAWTRVDTILEFSTNQQTKYYALQILEQVIETRWRALPRNQCDGIRKYIVGLIIKISPVPENLEREGVYLRKLNFILVQVCGHSPVAPRARSESAPSRRRLRW